MNEATIFHQALKIESSTERTLFLDRECGDDAELRENVETLLKSHTASEDFLDRPHLALAQRLLAEAGVSV